MNIRSWYQRNPWKNLLVGLSVIVVVGAFGFLLVATAPSSEQAVNAAKTMGFTDVEINSRIDGVALLGGCAEKDFTAFKATGTNPAGNRVGMTVCCGLVLKGCTVRSQ